MRARLGWLCFLAALCGASTQSVASANMMAPDRPGDRVSEPAPLLSTLHIVQEELRIDMRPVEAKEPVQISARYHVRNDGSAQRVELFFVAPGLRAGRVTHQGSVVPAQLDTRPTEAVVPRSNADSSWPRDALGLLFAIDFVPGEQVIEVAYTATPDTLQLDWVKSFAIDYELSPARRWASFGRLKVELLVPHGWDILHLPEALRGNAASAEYRGEFPALPSTAVHHVRVHTDHVWAFPELPADTFRFHIAPSRTPYQAMFALRVLLMLLAAAVPVLAALRLRQRRRAGHPVELAERAISFVVSLALLIALPLFAFWLEGRWLKHHTAGYGPLFALAGTWAFGAMAALVGHLWLGRRGSG